MCWTKGSPRQLYKLTLVSANTRPHQQHWRCVCVVLSTRLSVDTKILMTACAGPKVVHIDLYLTTCTSGFGQYQASPAALAAVCVRKTASASESGNCHRELVFSWSQSAWWRLSVHTWHLHDAFDVHLRPRPSFLSSVKFCSWTFIPWKISRVHRLLQKAC